MILRKQDSGKVIKLSAADVFQVELWGLGEEGYRWHVDRLDPEYVELLSEEIRISSRGKGDNPVRNLWTFRVKKKGLTEIEMYYYRQGKGIGEAKDRFLLNISIE
jgi:predicted secreted protein